MNCQRFEAEEEWKRNFEEDEAPMDVKLLQNSALPNIKACRIEALKLSEHILGVSISVLISQCTWFL